MTPPRARPARALRLFLAGDVMTGRGIDQLLPHPSDPALHERYMSSALDYVTLAERASGPIPRGVDPGHVWGDLAAALDARRPDLRFVNLETAVTRSARAEPKGVNYRMHPENIGVLTEARLDGVSLANNHVLDWAREGLAETLEALDAARIGHAGAGADRKAAEAPLVLRAGERALTVVALALADSGVPRGWAAGALGPGVALIAPDPQAAVDRVRAALAAPGRAQGPVMVSIHWGGNWGYEVPRAHRAIARALIEAAGVDVVHGHSAHHPKAAELHAGRLILYGCGDLLNDYEGIAGHEDVRPELALGYVADLDAATGALLGLEMLPCRLRRFRLERAGAEARDWLRARLDRECARFGGGVAPTPEGTLRLRLPG